MAPRKPSPCSLSSSPGSKEDFSDFLPSHNRVGARSNGYPPPTKQPSFSNSSVSRQKMISPSSSPLPPSPTVSLSSSNSPTSTRRSSLGSLTPPLRFKAIDELDNVDDMFISTSKLPPILLCPLHEGYFL